MPKTEKNTLRETIDRGESNVPLYVYNIASDKYMLYLHWHNEYEIVYVEEGSLVFTVNTVPVKVSAGQCIIINSGQLHSACFANNQASIHHALLFDMNFLSSLNSDYCQSTYISPLLKGQYKFPLIIDENESWGHSIIKEVREIIMLYNSKEIGWEIGIKANLYKILAIMAKENKFTSETINTPKSAIDYKIALIKKALNYIQKNYTKKIYLEDIAGELNMNPQYFCRFFKTNIGKTPVDYINQYRIEEAAKLINLEDRKISDVCFEVGFENFSYFIKKFKEYKGCTPNKYKGAAPL